MASACVNNVGVVAQESFLDSPTANSSMWRISPAEEGIRTKPLVDLEKDPDSDIAGIEFEFRLEDSVSSMLPADELFCDGKLVPRQLSNTRQSMEASSGSSSAGPYVILEKTQTHAGDSRLIYRKAPRSASRWKELPRLKKLSIDKEDSTSCSHRSTKSAMDSSQTLPLLQQQDDQVYNKSLSTSSRFSLNEVRRLSVDSEKSTRTTTKVRLAKQKPVSAAAATENRGNRRVPPECSLVQAMAVSIDSPRMNPSGKIVFYGLERSSSSPSSFNGDPRYKHGGMERSYSHSATLRIAPLLNVPVRSLRGGNAAASHKSSSTVFGIPIFSSSSSQHKNQNQSSMKGSRSSS